MKTFHIMTISRWILKMFQMKVVEKIKIHSLRSATFFRKSCRFWYNVEEYGGARDAANNIMAAHWMLN
jgi:hypothetical protein